MPKALADAIIKMLTERFGKRSCPACRAAQPFGVVKVSTGVLQLEKLSVATR